MAPGQAHGAPDRGVPPHHPRHPHRAAPDAAGRSGGGGRSSGTPERERRVRQTKQTRGPRVAACLRSMDVAEVRAGQTHSPPQIASRECGTPEFEAEEAERKANFRVQNFRRGRLETSSDRVKEARLWAHLSVETESAISHIPGSRSKVHREGAGHSEDAICPASPTAATNLLCLLSYPVHPFYPCCFPLSEMEHG